MTESNGVYTINADDDLPPDRVFIVGTSSADTVNLTVSGANLQVTINGSTDTYTLSQINSVWVRLYDGGDSFNVDENNISATFEIHGGRGDDGLESGGGDDLILGGAGADLLLANGGDDLLFGDAGNDTLYGGSGNDPGYGGSGSDSLFQLEPAVQGGPDGGL